MSIAETILDRAEVRFPLPLSPVVPKIRKLYKSATQRQWNPEFDIDWASFDHSRYSESQLRAARLRWSKTAWGEYGAISESPALQIRFSQERREPDLCLFFALRTQEESRHAEAAYRMAEVLGGYFAEPQGSSLVDGSAGGEPKPQEKDVKTALYSHGVRRMAFDPAYSTESIIASLVCVSEEVAFDQFKFLLEVTTDPVANKLLAMILRDEARHCAFGWDYLDHRIPLMSKVEIEAVKQGIETFVDTVEFNGYHHAWLKPPSADSRAEVAAMETTAQAGLGASTEALEKPVLIDSMAKIRKRMRDWGFTLKTFDHPKLGKC